MNRRSSSHRCLVAAVGTVWLVISSRRGIGADAFTTPTITTNTKKLSLSVPASRLQRSSIKTRTAARRDNVDNDDEELTSIIARPLFTAVTSAFLATSLLFSSPLLPTPDALATVATTTRPFVTETATSIDIDLSSLPALTRKAIVNREKLTNYLIESIKSFKPILDLLSESDAVIVTPPKNVKGAINQALTKGDAQFLVNGESVDVRIESVPGVIVIRVINPHIPRLPFLRDGTAAIQFIDNIVDAAPEQLEKAAEEVQNIGKFLSWGAPEQAPIQYRGSSLDNYLSSKFMVNGNTVSLGSFLGDLTNSEVALLVVSTGIGGAYAASYAYYVSLNEKAERDAIEAKEKKANEAAAKKKAKAEEDAKKAKAEAIAAAAAAEVAAAAETTAAAAKTDDTVKDDALVDVTKISAQASVDEIKVVSEPSRDKESTDPSDEKATKTDAGKKRDMIKNLFRRGK